MKVIDLKANQIQAIKQAVDVLKKGGLIVYPTDTCFGLGAQATNQAAVKKIFDFKGDRQKPIAIAVSDKHMASQYVQINEMADNIYKNFLPGPITVISKSKGKTVAKLESQQGTLGVRIPNYPFLLKLIAEFGQPITTTSANASGQKPPYNLDDFLKYNSKTRLAMVDLFLNPGPLPLRTPSTVVDTTLNEATIIRQGQIKLKDSYRQIFESNSFRKTDKIASEIYNSVKNTTKPTVFALQGELGAGKTQFTKGLARKLGVQEIITSPTFNIIKEYPFDNRCLYHIDTWRLGEEKDLVELGFNQMIKKNNIIVIEWPQKVKNMLMQMAKNILLIWVDIEIVSQTKRIIKYKILP